MAADPLPRRPGPTTRIRTVQHSDGVATSREDRVATEEPLEIRVAAGGAPAERVWVTMRTPGNDFELAAGFLVNENLMAPEDIATVAYCTDAELRATEEFNVVTVTTRSLLRIPQRSTHLSAGSSACGVCGKDSLTEALATHQGVRWSGAELTEAAVRAIPEAMRPGQKFFERTGGTHAAALVDGTGEIILLREDVGRHNAVDKAVGARALTGRPTAVAAVAVSGRAGFELVQKAVATGAGALVSVGAPTSLAVDLAASAGLALWGFTSADRTVRYA